EMCIRDRRSAWECIANHRNRVCGWVLALPRRAWERGGFCDNRLREDDGRGGVALLRHPPARVSQKVD
nr:hypothetical protein [Endozoicomonas sp.]